MSDESNTGFENYWLTMLDSVEVNLKSQRQHLLAGPPSARDAALCQPGFRWTDGKDYQRLTDEIIPTLERINRRANARRKAIGLANDNMPTAKDETLNIALRAVLKRRGK